MAEISRVFNVTIVTPRYLPLIGGQERQVHDLALALQKRGARVSIITEEIIETKNELLQIDEPGISVSRVRSSKFRSIVLIRFLTVILKQKQFPDLVISRTFSVHSLAVSMARLFLPWQKSGLTILMMDAETELDRFQNKFKSLLIRLVFSGFNLFNAPSTQLVNKLIEFGVSRNKITSIPNGVRIDRSSETVTTPRGSPTRFVYIGNIAKSKGVFELLEAFTRVRNLNPFISLTFIGNGSDLTSLQVEAGTLGDDRISFKNFVTFNEVDKELTKYDCLVYPSRTEGFGLIPFEAALLPLRIIASDVADLSRLLGNRARFFSPGSVDGLEEALLIELQNTEECSYSNRSWLHLLDFNSVVEQILSLAKRPNQLDSNLPNR